MSRIGRAGKNLLTKAKITTVLDALQDVDFDPVKEAIKLLPQLSPQGQFNGILSLMEYIYPKKTAMKFDTEINNQYQNLVISVSDGKLKDMAKAISAATEEA